MKRKGLTLMVAIAVVMGGMSLVFSSPGTDVQSQHADGYLNGGGFAGWGITEVVPFNFCKDLNPSGWDLSRSPWKQRCRGTHAQ